MCNTNNMATTFPESERRIYPKTFLKDVRLRLFFKETDRKSSKSILDFFNHHFGSTIDFEELKGGVLFKSNTDPISVTVHVNCIEIMISRPLYKRFAQIREWLPKMLEYISAFGADKVDRICIIKYNELDFTHVQKDFPVANVMKAVLNNNLISIVEESDFNKFNSLTRWEKMLKFDNVNDGLYEAAIEFGFRQKPVPEKLSGSITLKTLVSSHHDYNLDVVDNRIIDMNNVLDDIFHWSVSQSIIDKMK